ncbi:putative sugar phosphate transporter domain-containing protein [Helianthus annuus]|uniref:Sugar phosphate transporter domain-containing protein n=1 Tax=Helianthus annuus TaxID=4232 RepID=A0A9K3JHN1_HELAN|nr:putative sugar phosphate transporter domain-containing protein [Helianthus annuus]
MGFVKFCVFIHGFCLRNYIQFWVCKILCFIHGFCIKIDVQYGFCEILCFYTWVVLAHKIGHVAATVSMSKLAVSFTHIIKSGEPAFSVLVSRFILGDSMYSRLW